MKLLTLIPTLSLLIASAAYAQEKSTVDIHCALMTRSQTLGNRTEYASRKRERNTSIQIKNSLIEVFAFTYHSEGKLQLGMFFYDAVTKERVTYHEGPFESFTETLNYHSEAGDRFSLTCAIYEAQED